MKRTTLTAVFAVLAMVLTAGLAQADWASGTAAFKAGNWAVAQAEFQAIVDAQPDWFGGHFMLGWTKLKQNKGKEAVQSLRKAYDLQPSDANIQLRLGEAYVQTGRHSDAVAFLSKINAASLPKNAQGYLAQLKAVALTNSGQAASAVGELRKAANANPNDADIWFSYGSTAYSTGDTTTAIPALAKAVQLDPSDMEKQKVYAQALVSQARRARGSAKADQYQKAAVAAQRVVSGNPSFDNLMLLGGAQLGAKQYDGAVSTYQQAAAKNSNDWLPGYHLGQALTAKAQYRSAESALRASLDRAQSPQDQATIWKQLGFVYEKQKNFAGAITAYNRGGDSAGAARVRKNKETEEENKRIEAENLEIQRIKDEQAEIEAELKNLPGAAPPQR
ncbi:MAG: tetratricopeptide repeat protein [bacterium]|nr:tetratricopeptide repeat protein [bacterium]